MKIRITKVHTGLWLLLLTGLVLAGCAPQQRTIDDSFAFVDYLEPAPEPDRANMSQKERFAYDYRSAAVARMRDETVSLPNTDLIARAKTAIGTPYVRGGTSRSGFDCSGFVQWAYRHVGVKLPRTAQEQSVLGTAIDADEMEAGDIVAFKHPRRGYHTGIYIGDGKFIHSPRRGKRVEITSLDDPYFSSTFLGARRVEISEADVETAERLVAMYESRSHRKASSDASLSRRSDREKATYTSSRKKAHRQSVATKNSRVSEKKAARDRKTSVSSTRSRSEQKARASRSTKKENARLVSQSKSKQAPAASRKTRSSNSKKNSR